LQATKNSPQKKRAKSSSSCISSTYSVKIRFRTGL
jgi:hypothetical protein